MWHVNTEEIETYHTEEVRLLSPEWQTFGVKADGRASSDPGSPGLGEFLVSWFLGIFLVLLSPSIVKSRRLGCQYLGLLGLNYLILKILSILMKVEDSRRVTQEALVIVDDSWMNIYDDYCLIVQQYK
jgi:hypothetical protein